MGLTRNRAFACQLALLAGALAVFAAAAAAVEGPRAGLWVLAAGALACALFATFSLRRYRQIARLASEVDEVLHGGRRIAFSDYREGDLAVLRNELAKMVAALRTATERLDAEKNALADALADVGLQGFDKRETAALSGGQKQRVAIAGVLAMEPAILILDEATAMLDPRGRKGLMRVCRELHDRGMTVVMIRTSWRRPRRPTASSCWKTAT